MFFFDTKKSKFLFLKDTRAFLDKTLITSDSQFSKSFQMSIITSGNPENVSSLGPPGLKRPVSLLFNLKFNTKKTYHVLIELRLQVDSVN
jgi:hypothetical protein